MTDKKSSIPGYQDGQHFYCAPDKEVKDLDLTVYNDEFQQLILENCKSVVLNKDYIPESVLFINVSESGIKLLNIKKCDQLQQIIMFNVAGL